MTANCDHWVYLYTAEVSVDEDLEVLTAPPSYLHHQPAK